jgi:hypothetical protein
MLTAVDYTEFLILYMFRGRFYTLRLPLALIIYFYSSMFLGSPARQKINNLFKVSFPRIELQRIFENTVDY